MCEFFSSDHDLIKALHRVNEKHPNKSIKGVYYINQYLVFELS